MNKRVTITLAATLVFLAIAALLVPSIVLSGAHAITLRDAPQLTGQVAQALANSQKAGSVPETGKAFTLSSVDYFENNTWAVASIKGDQRNVTDGIAVLQLREGIFQVVVGPGTAFPSSVTRKLPPSVTGYLNQRGVIYGSI